MSRQDEDEHQQRNHNIQRSEERRRLCLAFGRRLAAARRRRGLTQAALGEALDVRTWMVSRYELGRSVPRLEVLVRLRSALAVSLDHLLAGADDPAGTSPVPSLPPR
jgi:transcriptional regulator with XRE-family HTH domain